MTTRAGKAQKVKEEEEERKETNSLEDRVERMETNVIELKADFREMKDIMKMMAEKLTPKDNKEVSIDSDIDSLHSANPPQPSTFSTAIPTVNMRKDDAVQEMAINKHSQAGMGQTAVIIGNVEKMSHMLPTIYNLASICDWKKAWSLFRLRNRESKQLMISTLESNALEELQLASTYNLAGISDETLDMHIKLIHKQYELEDIKILEVVNGLYLTGMKELDGVSEFRLSCISNLQVFARYIGSINFAVQTIYELTGMRVDTNRPRQNYTTAKFPYSTIWEIVWDKLDAYGKGWKFLIVNGIDVKEHKDWSSLSSALKDKVQLLTNKIQENAPMIESFIKMGSKACTKRAAKYIENNLPSIKANLHANPDAKLWQPPKNRSRTGLASIEDTMDDESEVVESTELDQEPANADVDELQQDELDRLSQKLAFQMFSEEQKTNLAAVEKDKAGKTACYSLLRGKCKWGKSCSYSHELHILKRAVEELKQGLGKLESA